MSINAQDQSHYPYPYEEEYNIPEPQPQPKSQRLDSLDFARGIAITLMILSHTVKGLLSFEQMPDWGIVPVHAITKFSSSLFFTCFGMSLALFFLPAANSSKWTKRRNRLWIRAVEIMIWYKILTVVQMYMTYEREAIINTLLFYDFPDFVEVLGFYSFSLLWLPLILPVWKQIPVLLKPAIIVALAYYGNVLTMEWPWGDQYLSLKAILVEHKGQFTFGQFQRGAMALFGVLLGEAYLAWKKEDMAEIKMGLWAVIAGIMGLSYFFISTASFTDQALIALAKNYGKHPPSLLFTSFSMGGALCILGLAFLMGPKVPWILRPFTLIGQFPMFSFCFHIVIVFVIFRDYCGFHRRVDYTQALQLTGALVVATMFICWFLSTREERRKL